MNLESQLKKYRKIHGLTQDDIAKYLNISRQSVSKWENGKSYPDLDNLLLLSKLYKITINELMGADCQDDNDLKPMEIKKKKSSFNKINIGYLLFFISIITFFILPIGAVISILVLVINKKSNELYRAVICSCILSISFSVLEVLIFLFL